MEEKMEHEMETGNIGISDTPRHKAPEAMTPIVFFSLKGVIWGLGFRVLLSSKGASEKT